MKRAIGLLLVIAMLLVSAVAWAQGSTDDQIAALQAQLDALLAEKAREAANNTEKITIETIFLRWDGATLTAGEPVEIPDVAVVTLKKTYSVESGYGETCDPAHKRIVVALHVMSLSPNVLDLHSLLSGQLQYVGKFTYEGTLVSAKYPAEIAPLEPLVEDDVVLVFTVPNAVVAGSEDRILNLQFDDQSFAVTIEIAALPPVISQINADATSVSFGDYTWRVLAVEGDKALLITEGIIEARAYHSKRESVTWEKSALRAYLNGEFYNKFSDAEKSVILETTLANKDNAQYNTAGGNDTQDKVFLLSLDEINQYFKGDANRAAGAWWWLRSPGFYDNYAASVNNYGYVNRSGDFVDSAGGGVRPAFYINLNP